MTETKKITSGTKEWSDSSVNLYFGCSNNCRYCYAKMMAIRFERKTEENWHKMILNKKAFNKGYGKRKGRIMFPTSHDITIETLSKCYIVLLKLLEAGNNVLITTKPQIVCTQILCHTSKRFKDQIQFRFTITSNNDDRLQFWEPNAPDYIERKLSLSMAYQLGYKTSISIEPFLDKDPIPLIKDIAPFVTESIWIGKMNYISQNVSPEDQKYYDYQRFISSWSNLQKILKNLDNLSKKIKSKIRLKDSIRNLKEFQNLSKYQEIGTYPERSRHRSLGEGGTTSPIDRFQIKKDGGGLS